MESISHLTSNILQLVIYLVIMGLYLFGKGYLKIRSTALAFRSFDDMFSIMSLLKKIEISNCKKEESIVFKSDGMLYSITWKENTPYLHLLMGYNTFLSILVWVVSLDTIENIIGNEVIMNVIYVLSILFVAYVLFKERESLKNMWSRNFNEKQKIQYEELLDYLDFHN